MIAFQQVSCDENVGNVTRTSETWFHTQTFDFDKRLVIIFEDFTRSLKLQKAIDSKLTRGNYL